MSVYNCEVCSFYTDRKNKLLTHLKTQKHKENIKNKLETSSNSACGQKNMQHRTLKTQDEKTNICPRELPEPFTEISATPSVFTLLEIKDNQVMSSRQVDISNSIINFT